MEGRKTAKLLKAAGNIQNVTLCPDASIAEVVPRMTYCVVGADAIQDNGNVVNKTGKKNLNDMRIFVMKIMRRTFE